MEKKTPILPGTNSKPLDPRMDALQYEIMQETAQALGRIGRRLEEALAALKRHDETPGSNQDRDALVQEAADRAFALFIQRDYLGLRTDHHLTSTYDIPREVMLRVGVMKKAEKT
ncbi:hypothetical protein FF124_00810 [Martelella lutilitoris]|uniref:Uncharacterized protein n=1 Tax=Martelella lutilitoris TaxID=2583532 RepID=A0A5C4JVQ2_9HYPH|nr:DUF6665 family protein [Martelella lutilitoris]TNB49533.1 hypothetical protein FF124_00810 [Martelella lutilitoris]